MNKRTELYLRFIIPLKVRLRRRAIWWLENAIDRLDLDKCRRYDNAVTFQDFISEADRYIDDLFTSDDDDYL